MTPYAHHNNDLYLSAYREELTKALTETHSGGSTVRHGIRRSIAQSLVRIGTWMLPDASDFVEGRILVLEIEHPSGAHQRAA